jgi:hypothetical protein
MKAPKNSAEAARILDLLTWVRKNTPTDATRIANLCGMLAATRK